MKYAILYNPGHNRVYYETSLSLSISEFCIVAQRLSTEHENVQQQDICGINYLTFQTKDQLCENDIRIISDLSFLYAFFEIENVEDEIRLRPIKKVKENFVDESIGTIQKYTGKTNEIFTRMMINIAFYS